MRLLDRRGPRADLIEPLAGVWPVDAVGHRIVHGVDEDGFSEPLAPGVVAELHARTDLAPLHQPGSLAALEVVGQALPGVRHVACLDTAFHVALPPAATTYALPAAWRKRWPLRRYGVLGPLGLAWPDRAGDQRPVGVPAS